MVSGFFSYSVRKWVSLSAMFANSADIVLVLSYFIYILYFPYSTHSAFCWCFITSLSLVTLWTKNEVHTELTLLRRSARKIESFLNCKLIHKLVYKFIVIREVAWGHKHHHKPKIALNVIFMTLSATGTFETIHDNHFKCLGNFRKALNFTTIN